MVDLQRGEEEQDYVGRLRQQNARLHVALEAMRRERDEARAERDALRESLAYWKVEAHRVLEEHEREGA